MKKKDPGGKGSSVQQKAYSKDSKENQQMQGQGSSTQALPPSSSPQETTIEQKINELESQLKQ